MSLDHVGQSPNNLDVRCRELEQRRTTLLTSPSMEAAALAFLQPDTYVIFHTQQRRFDACEAEVLEAVRTGGSESDGELLSQRLGSALEFCLCDVLVQIDGLHGYWCDGVMIERLGIREDTVEVEGDAWICHGRDQWLVPVRARFVVVEGRIRSFLIDLGNRNVGTLAEHKHAHRTADRPSDWLFSLEVEPAPVAD